MKNLVIVKPKKKVLASTLSNKGLSFYISVGRCGGVGIRFDGGIQFVLGVISIGILFVDIEVLLVCI